MGKQHISLHNHKGAFENRVNRDDEKEDFVNFLRLEPEQFNFILDVIANFATKTKKRLLTSCAEN